MLFPFVSNQIGFDTSISIANTSAEPFGRSPTKGEVILHYFGNTTGGGPAPNPQRSLSVPPGQSLVFTLSSGGSYHVEATPGFQRCIIADCEFPDGEGFAALSQFPQIPNKEIHSSLTKLAKLASAHRARARSPFITEIKTNSGSHLQFLG